MSTILKFVKPDGHYKPPARGARPAQLKKLEERWWRLAMDISLVRDKIDEERARLGLPAFDPEAQ